MGDGILFVEIPGIGGGVGAVSAACINAILPDMSSPSNQSIIYMDGIEDGLSVAGDSETIITDWIVAIEKLDEEEELDDG